MNQEDIRVSQINQVQNRYHIMSICLLWKQVKLIKVGSRMMVLKESEVVMVRTVRGHKVSIKKAR